MRRNFGIGVLLWILSSIVTSGRSNAADPTVIDVWPNLAPGETTKQIGLRQTRSSSYGPLNTLGGADGTDQWITRPQLTIYRPADAGKAIRPAIIVCPGGGYTLLATDIEGSEIAQWLNAQGYVAAVLTYRVPDGGGKQNDPTHLRALQDAQRAIALLRTNATKYGIDPTHIGMIGTSAGGHLATHTAAANGTSAYPPVDAADKASVRPDFVMAIYPAYLVANPRTDSTVQPEVKPVSGMPPFFLVETKDDYGFYPNVPVYAAALDKAGVPEAQYVYNSGGHGYGIRLSADHDASAWVDRAANWLETVAPVTPNNRVAVLTYCGSPLSWDRAKVYPLTPPRETAPSNEAIDASWQGLWDTDSLHLLVTVTRPAANSAPSAGNSVTIAIDSTDGKAARYQSTDYQYVFDMDKNTIEERRGGVPTTGASSVRFTSTVTADGYRLEMTLPWKDLNREPSGLIGLEIAVDGGRTDSGRPLKLLWNAPVDSAGNSPASFGTALMVPGAGLYSGSASAASQ